MANLLILKRRIKTAQNVAKTTKAMQMIAASKLKRAQDSALSSRPYVTKLTEISKELSSKVPEEKLNDYMKKQLSINSKLLIVVAPDKGLCGGLVTNLTRELVKFARENRKVTCITVGKKAKNSVSLVGGENIAHFDIGTTLPSYDLVYPIMKLVDEYFLNKRVSEVITLNTNFESVFSQKPIFKKLLPVTFEEETRNNASTIFEPKPEEILPGLIRHYLEMNVYQAMLENYLSEQGARMISMQNATDNAKEIIEELKLIYNKGRQEKITNEILDITGAAAYV